MSTFEVGQAVSFAPSRAKGRATGTVDYVGAGQMVAVKPDDPFEVRSDLDPQGRVWRFAAELGPPDGPPDGDRVAKPNPDAPETLSGFTFAAKFPSTCPGCGQTIGVGAAIQRSSRRRYFHEGCTP